MIKIICIGKLKESYLKNALLDYTKRISKYHKIEILELPDSNMIEEEKLILAHLPSKSYIITLEIEGKMLNSKEFSQKIDNVFLTNGNITFIIGGSEGLSDHIKNISNYALSFSKMTFPHGLFRIILLEQIYRAFKILNHETYHK